jgi:peroxiredoxin
LGDIRVAVLALLARLFLAAVFGFAGVAKMLDRVGSRKAITDFGAPEWLAAPLGYGLPFIEITIACLLIIVQTALLGAFGSVALLSVFIVGIAENIGRGKRPNCHCFGQLHSEPIGYLTLCRNGFLLVVAATLLWLGSQKHGLSLTAGMKLIFAGHALLSILAGGFVLALVAQVYLTLHLFRQNGRLLLRIEALESATGTLPKLAIPQRAELASGSPAPRFELPLTRGGTGSFDHLIDRGKPIVLVFSDAACGPCKALMPELVRWRHQYSERLTVAVVMGGLSKEKLAIQTDLEYMFIQNDREVASRYGAFGTPSAIVITKDGLVGSPVVSGAQAIGNLVLAATNGDLPASVARPIPRPIRNVLSVGSPSPQLTLPDLSGKSISLSDFLGHQTLLLFWNPKCGFCARMLPHLKELEQSLSGTISRIVLISTGRLELNSAMGLRSPVLLDQGQRAMGLFGASGTPSALLVDHAGNVASSLAVGADAIFALAGHKPATADETELSFRRIEQQAI